MRKVSEIYIPIRSVKCPECREELDLLSDPRGADPIECEFCGLEFQVTQDATVELSD